MIHKIDYFEIQSKEQREAHESKWGKSNDAPPGFTEITAEEFAQSGFFTWCKLGIEFRQICNFGESKLLKQPKNREMLSITLFYMNHGDNYGMAHDYWDKKVRYFKFTTCYHNYVEVGNQGMRSCYNVCKCNKCGDVWEYDSSG